jgi:hypothetical protein
MSPLIPLFTAVQLLCPRRDEAASRKSKGWRARLRLALTRAPEMNMEKIQLPGVQGW